MKAIVALVLLFLVATGCGSTDDDTGAREEGTGESSTTEPPDVALIGTSWFATEYFDGDRQVLTQPPDENAQVTFEENGFVTGHDGCNGFGYSPDAAPDDSGRDIGKTYDVTADRITFTGTSVSTLIGCNEKDHRVRFHAVLTGTVTYVLDGSTLTLVDSDNRRVRFEARDDRG